MSEKKSFLDKIKSVNTEIDSKEIESNIEIPEKDDDKLQEQKTNVEYEKIKTELENFKEIALRKAAELENLKRRSQEDLEKAIKYSISNFSKELLPVMDALYLAIDNVPKDELKTNDKFKNFFEGVNITLNELKKVFDKNNIKRIYPLGEIFNHDLHQAIMQVESEQEEGVIVNVIQAGYILNDRLIRPAMVAVSKNKNNN